MRVDVGESLKHLGTSKQQQHKIPPTVIFFVVVVAPTFTHVLKCHHINFTTKAQLAHPGESFSACVMPLFL